MSRDRAITLQALIALIFGVHWVVVKVGLDYIPPFTYGALRFGSAAIVVGILLGLTGRIRLPPRHDLRVVLAMGIGQMAIQVALLNLALLVLPAGRSSVLLFTMPLWVAVIQIVVLRRPPLSRELIGLALGILGVALLVSPASLPTMTPAVALGVAMLLVGAMVWAATLLVIGAHRWESTPLDLLLWELLVALVPLAVLALVAEGGQAIDVGLPAVAVVLYSGPLATAFAFWASQSVQRSLPPAAAAIGFLAVPVVGLASGAILLGEPLTLVDLAAAGITLLGIGVVMLQGGRSATGSSPGPA
jgi:drug/metabolite transporter (DMT)-like permease